MEYYAAVKKNGAASLNENSQVPKSIYFDTICKTKQNRKENRRGFVYGFSVPRKYQKIPLTHRAESQKQQKEVFFSLQLLFFIDTKEFRPTNKI